MNDRVDVVRRNQRPRRLLFFFSSRRRHTRYWRDWSSDVCSSDLREGRRMTGTPRATGRIAGIGGGLVGYLVFVEFTSGVLQGYYIPLLTDIARDLGVHDADVNWLEAAQLMLSAIAVPILAKLGDLHGHRRMLLASAAVVAASTVVLALARDFPLFLVAWAFQGRSEERRVGK